MHIKICGLTSLDDTLAAIDAGADYLGFNFYPPSPRYLTPQACGRLLAHLAQRGLPVTTVGVFVNQPPAEVAAVLDQCGLDLAQLHGDTHALPPGVPHGYGDERPDPLHLLRGRAFRALRDAVALTGDDLAALSLLSSGRPAFLLDAQVPNAYGGTGRLADWDVAATLAAKYPIFLAGGLTPANVAAAIGQVNPWGVDVASGVECAPGVKDHDKMKAFVRTASQAATALPTGPGATQG